jgi:hypothetical protein
VEQPKAGKPRSSCDGPECAWNGTGVEKGEIRAPKICIQTAKTDWINLPSSSYDGRISRAIQPTVLVSLTSTGCSRPRYSQMISSQEAKEISIIIIISIKREHIAWGMDPTVEMFRWISFLRDLIKRMCFIELHNLQLCCGRSMCWTTFGMKNTWHQRE